jgi:hypothetical protein
VRLWARPGFYNAKLSDDFGVFCDNVAAAVRADRTTIKLYYFRDSVVVAERIAIADAVSLGIFASTRCAVWVFEPAEDGPPSPDQDPGVLPGAVADPPIALVAPLSRGGRSSQQQRTFRAAVLKRDGAACVLCGLTDASGGKSRLEAAHVVAVSTPATILDQIPLINLFDTLNGIVLCADCHYWYDRHMWHVDDDGNVCVAGALLHHAGCDRWAMLGGRTLRLPSSPPLLAIWPPPYFWAFQKRLCLAAAAARAEVVADKPFFCDMCGARAMLERGLRRHTCGTDRHMFTPLLARAFPETAAAAASLGKGDGGGRQLSFLEDASVAESDGEDSV